MAKQRKAEEPAPGSPAWMATFSDLMNLLLCFFVLLFSMSTVDAQKFELVAASFSDTFSIFSNGGQAVGEGMLISNGVSQLNELDDYLHSVGRPNDTDQTITDALDELEEQKLAESEALAEKVEEALSESGLDDEIGVTFNSQYVQLTLNGSLLFDSGDAQLKEESMAVMSQIAKILDRYAEGIIEVEGHTDNVPMNGFKYSNNEELSSARAISVFHYLMENTTIEPSRVKYSGRGEYVPIADNSTPEGRALNRRVEIKIYNTLSSY